jgi:hypothetical protein
MKSNLQSYMMIYITILLPPCQRKWHSSFRHYMCGKKYTALNLLILLINYTCPAGVVQGKILWFIEII